jgi:protein-S-isoprenylcysteine O-methyltransferase Ste14
MTGIGCLQVGVVAVLAGALGAKILAQRRRGIRSVVLGKAEDGLLARLEPVALGTLFFWFGAIALHGTGWAPRVFEPRLFRSSASETAGAVLTVCALGLLITALRHMGRSWRIGIDAQSREHLVTRGVFSISRNPIFLAIDLIALAAFLISGALFFLISGVLVLAGIHVQILREERFLGTACGDEYGRYRSRVHRYLGRRKLRTPREPGP